jgi:Anti-sigma-D factor RsdA to sigma factor binding region
MPADLAAVQADDTLLDLIGRPGYSPSDEQDELTRLLAGWRQEMETEPFRELVDTDTAVAAIRAGRRPVRRRNPVFGSIAAAAAVLVIAFSSVGLVAKSAQPGDRLWGVTQVLYGDYARSVETAASVRTELNEARTALKQGDPERARASLQRVQNQLPAISESEGRTDLTVRSRELEQQVSQSSGLPMESPSTQVPSKIDSRTSPKPGQLPILTPGSWPGQRGSVPDQRGSVPDQRGSVPDQRGSVPDQQGSVPDQQGSVPGQQGSVPGQVGPPHGQPSGPPHARPGSHGQLGPPHGWPAPPVQPGSPPARPGQYGHSGLPGEQGQPGSQKLPGQPSS